MARSRALTAAVAFVAVLGTTLSLSTVPANAEVGDSARKVIAKNFPDPGFAKFTTKAHGTKYYLYATGAGFRVASSAKPRTGFTIHGNSMTKRPGWTVPAGGDRPAQLWAPHVFQTSTTPGQEKFTMYFTARRASDYRHCIGAARSNSPQGPFTPKAKPLVCPRAGYSEAIDPVEYTSRHGNRYLVYKIGNYAPRRFQILGVRVGNAAGIARVGKPKTMLSTSQIGSSVAEAPDVHRGPNGRVHLFVSRNGYKGCDYATQVWSGPGLFELGRARWVAGMGPAADLCGAGGAEVIRDGSTLRVGFHVRHRADPLVRHAWTGVLKWSKAGSPYLS